MTTAFRPANMEFSTRAHRAAEAQLYPVMFANAHPLLFGDRVGTDDDLDRGIDYTVTCHPAGLRAGMTFTIQERWRRVHEMGRNDVTITEWNLKTNLPSELYKIQADILVYGFYDDRSDLVHEAVGVDMVAVRWHLAHSRLRVDRLPRGDGEQLFVAIAYSELRRVGAWLGMHKVTVPTPPPPPIDEGPVAGSLPEVDGWPFVPEHLRSKPREVA